MPDIRVAEAGGALALHSCSYHSECGDHSPHRGHIVICQWYWHAGQTPPVSNVFQLCPHTQDQRSSARGAHLHLGQRMRGSVGPEVPPMSAKVSVSITTAQCKVVGLALGLWYTVVPPTCGSPARTTRSSNWAKSGMSGSGTRSMCFAAALTTGSEYSARSRAANWNCRDIFGGYPYRLIGCISMTPVKACQTE